MSFFSGRLTLSHPDPGGADHNTYAYTYSHPDPYTHTNFNTHPYAHGDPLGGTASGRWRQWLFSGGVFWRVVASCDSSLGLLEAQEAFGIAFRNDHVSRSRGIRKEQPGLEERALEIYFVRHGETEWNSLELYQGRSDVPLNGRGRAQAAFLAERVASIKPRSVFYSPLSRARETAEIALRVLGQVEMFVSLESLQEWDFGLWEGLSGKVIEETYGKAYSRWRENPEKETPQGGESLHDLRDRVRGALATIQDTGLSPVLVVTHGGVIRAALMELFGLGGGFFWQMRVSNCSVSRVIRKEGAFSLSLYNDDSHIKAEV